MIGGPEQRAADPDAIARQREGDDLSSPVRQQLEAAAPSRLKDIGGPTALALVRQFLAPRQSEGRGLQIGEKLQFRL